MTTSRKSRIPRTRRSMSNTCVNLKRREIFPSAQNSLSLLQHSASRLRLKSWCQTSISSTSTRRHSSTCASTKRCKSLSGNTWLRTVRAAMPGNYHIQLARTDTIKIPRATFVQPLMSSSTRMWPNSFYLADPISRSLLLTLPSMVSTAF